MNHYLINNCGDWENICANGSNESDVWWKCSKSRPVWRHWMRNWLRSGFLPIKIRQKTMKIFISNLWRKHTILRFVYVFNVLPFLVIYYANTRVCRHCMEFQFINIFLIYKRICYFNFFFYSEKIKLTYSVGFTVNLRRFFLKEACLYEILNL